MALKDKLMTLEDFKAVRDVDVASNSAQFTEIKADLDAIEPGLSDDAKTALLNCFANVAWINEHGPDYYEALADALNVQIDVLSATFDSKNRTIYVDDPVDSIKYFLIVKWNDETVRPSGYTLSGTLKAGNNELLVTYNGKTTKVIVPAEEIKWNLSYTNNDIQRYNGSANKYAEDSSGYGGSTLKPNNKIRTFVSPNGRHPFYLDNDSFQTDKYPIPVPKNATSVVITPGPGTYYTAIHCLEYHPDRIGWQPYTPLSPEITFTQGPAVTLQLPQAETSFGMRVIGMNIRRDRNGSAYTDTTNPTECVVQFS